MTDSSRPRSIGLLAVAAASAVLTVLLAIRLPLALRDFRKMFVSFGVTTPPATTLVLDTPHIWWLPAVASIAVLAWVAVKPAPGTAELRRMKIAVVTLIALTALSYGFAAFAIYVPIFKLSTVV